MGEVEGLYAFPGGQNNSLANTKTPERNIIHCFSSASTIVLLLNFYCCRQRTILDNACL